MEQAGVLAERRVRGGFLATVTDRRGPVRDTLRRLRRQRGAVIGLALLAVLLVLAAAPGFFETHDPYHTHLIDALTGPGAAHPFGTDHLGRDILSRTIEGTRNALLIGIAPSLIGAVIGSLIGLIGGYFGAWTDAIMMRGLDMMMAFPGLILALAIVAALGRSTTHVIIAIGIAFVPAFARVTRGSVIAARENLYVSAALATGAGNGRILLRHVLPNVIAPVIVLVSLAMAGAVLTGASLSFLGFGARPPTIEWGSLVSDGRDYLGTGWWISTFPGLMLMVLVVAVNFIGDGLRDVLDPRLRM